MSRLIEMVATPSAPAPDAALTVAGYVAEFEAVPCTETTAALRLVAAFSQDEELRAHISGTLATRRHHLPSWLAHLDDAHVDGEVLLMTDPLGDRSSHIFAVRMAGGVRFTVIVCIDHTVAGAVREAMVVLDTPDAVVATSREAIRRASSVSGEPTVTPADPPDARAAIEFAIAQGTRVCPPFESSTWPANRALVEWAVRLLPSGGAAPIPPSWSESDLRRIADTFFASPDSSELHPGVYRGLLELALRFAVESRGCDPLRWTPVLVMSVLSWAAQNRVIDDDDAMRLTLVLIAWVPYSCRLRGVDAQTTAEIRGVVERLADEFIDSVYEHMTDGEEEDDDEDEAAWRSAM